MGTRISPRVVRTVSGSLTAAAAAGIAVFVWVHVRQTNREVAVSAPAPAAPTKTSGRERRESRASREVAPTTRGAEAADFVPIPFPKSPLEFYVRLLQSGDARDRAFAKEKLHALARDEARKAADPREWLRVLAMAGLLDDARALAAASVTRSPQDGAHTADAQIQFAQILLAAGEYDAALPQAKAAYNVATVKTTPRAAALLAEALRHGPGGAAAAAAFAERQGAAAPPKEPLSFLASVTIDPAPYAEAAQKVEGSDKFDDLLALGNLSLLADRPKDAEAAFVAACGSPDAKGKKLFTALEGVARALRAADASPARANVFLSALAGGQVPPDIGGAKGNPSLDAATLKVAAQRIGTMSPPAIADAIAKGPPPLAAPAAPARPPSGAHTLWDPVEIASMGWQPDPELVAWLTEWRKGWAAGQPVQAADRTRLEGILAKTTDPAAQLVEVAHAVHMRSPDDQITSSVLYDGASRRAETEVAKLGESPAGVAVLRVLVDHMQDYKDTLWPLIEGGDRRALSVLHRIYACLAAHAAAPDDEVRKTSAHVRVGLSECMSLEGRKDEALGVLAPLGAAKMTPGEKDAFEWSEGLILSESRRSAEAVPHLAYVADSKTSKYSRAAAALLIRALAESRNAAEADKRYASFLQKYHPGASEALDLALALEQAKIPPPP